MSYIDETLMKDEEIIYRTKPHWVIFSPAIGWLVLAILILYLAPRYHFATMNIFSFYTLTDILGIIVLIIAIISGLAAYINYQTSEYGITNRRILMKVGFISRTTLEILLQCIESIQVYQSIPGRIFGYGSIVISGIGGSKDPFSNIPDPLLFRQHAQEELEHIRYPSYS
jgi:uncharacterized membrane protein YdbT with pleckstrin-like domain